MTRATCTRFKYLSLLKLLSAIYFLDLMRRGTLRASVSTRESKQGLRCAGALQ